MTTGISWLDIKLGIRNLVKFPLLTVVGGVSIMATVALAAGWFEFSWDMNNPAIPFDNADRIVRIRNVDVVEGGTEPVSPQDFEAWRSELESIRQLSAITPFPSTVTTDAGRSNVIDGARVTASGFGALRVTPYLGRSFGEPDMDPGAPAAVIVGFDLWQRLFDGDSTVIGRMVRLGTVTSTVVGVMPEGFGFPTNEEFWVPLRNAAANDERGESSRMWVFGRLAPGYTLAQAQAELRTIGAHMAAESPATHEGLRPQAGPLVDLGFQATFAAGANLVFILLLIVISANVATLAFARTATRQPELTMRSALGASRRRIVLQLCTEAFVLTVGAAAVGLAVADWGIQQAMDLFWQVQQMRPPYWWDSGLSATTILYVLGLAAVGAAVIGGLPALRATGRRVRVAVNHLGSGASGLKFGRISTAVIMVQVALCVIFVPLAIERGQELLEEAGVTDSTGYFAANEYLSGRLARDLELPPDGETASWRAETLARTGALQEEVRRRLAAEAGITTVTFYSRLAGFNHPVERIQIEGANAPADARAGVPLDSAADPAVRSLSVDLNFFDVANTRLVAGRTFQAGDLESEVGVAIVSQRFVAEKLDGRNAIGRRLRYLDAGGEEGPRWYEIVGVVQDPALIAASPGDYVGLYHPLASGDEGTIRILLHTSSNPAARAPRVRSVVASVDPSLVIEDVAPLADVWRPVQRGNVFFTTVIAAVVVLALLLSLAGMYSLMSFTVAQRTREIGVRAALGARPGRIVFDIFSRALAQIGLGVLAGIVLLSVTIADSGLDVGLVAGVASLMMAVGLLACVLPARRAVRIQPTEALRGDT